MHEEQLHDNLPYLVYDCDDPSNVQGYPSVAPISTEDDKKPEFAGLKKDAVSTLLKILHWHDQKSRIVLQDLQEGEKKAKVEYHP